MNDEAKVKELLRICLGQSRYNCVSCAKKNEGINQVLSLLREQPTIDSGLWFAKDYIKKALNRWELDGVYWVKEALKEIEKIESKPPCKCGGSREIVNPEYNHTRWLRCGNYDGPRTIPCPDCKDDSFIPAINKTKDGQELSDEQVKELCPPDDVGEFVAVESLAIELFSAWQDYVVRNEPDVIGLCWDNLTSKNKKTWIAASKPAADHIAQLQREKAECREILENNLDRDKDPKDSLRDLVSVACNALWYARAKKKHFVAANLKVEIAQLQKQINKLTQRVEDQQEMMADKEAINDIQSQILSKLEKQIAELKQENEE